MNEEDNGSVERVRVKKKGGDRLARLGFSKRGVTLTKTKRPMPQRPEPVEGEPEVTKDVSLEG